jgi:nicotinamidase-related amidase
MSAPSRRALVVIDVQQGFDDPAMGVRNNPACEANVAALVEHCRGEGDALVLVRHDSDEPASPLRPGQPGNAFKPFLADVAPDLLVPKNVHSSFHGRVDLHAWLSEQGIADLIVCGIQTNRCCETTTRVAGDLGYRVQFAIDATHTFDEGGRSADDLAAVTAINLDGHFARVVTTQEVLDVAAAAEASGA